MVAPLLKPKPKPPPKPRREGVLFRPPDAGMIAELDRIAEVAGLSRNETMSQLLRWAIDEYKRQQPSGDRKK